MRIHSCRAFWLSAATLLVAIVACAWLLVPCWRITQHNLDRIQKGMTAQDVEKILGEGEHVYFDDIEYNRVSWREGISGIDVWFDSDGKAVAKVALIASTRETIEYYAKEWAKKVGIKWQ
jgi:hypothetical protein